MNEMLESRTLLIAKIPNSIEIYALRLWAVKFYNLTSEMKRCTHHSQFSNSKDNLETACHKEKHTFLIHRF